MLRRTALLGLTVLLACGTAAPTERAPAQWTTAAPTASNANATATSLVASSSVPEPAPSASAPVKEPPSDPPIEEPGAVEISTFEAGLEEILDARPIRETKRPVPIVKANAETLAARAKAMAPNAKGKGKAHANAAAAFEELAYASRRDLAKAPPSAAAAELKQGRSAAQLLALEHCFEAIAEDNTLAEAKYRAAHLLHVAGDVVRARKQYFILVENHPNSDFVPLAYLGFALLFAEEAKVDRTKWPFVELSAEKALEQKGNPATPEALLLIARAQRGTGKSGESVETMRKLRADFPKSAASKRAP